MKKIFMVVAMVATLGLTSCGWFNKEDAVKDAEVVLEALEEAKDAAEDAVETVVEVAEEAKAE